MQCVTYLNIVLLVDTELQPETEREESYKKNWRLAVARDALWNMEYP